MKIILGADHAGFEMKEQVKALLLEEGHVVEDAGTMSAASCDYPDFAAEAARAVASGEADRGILVCGTGIGMSIAANKIKGVRAAACHNLYVAHHSRAHNDANILCLGARVLDPVHVEEIVREWLTVPFEGDRHVRRLKKIHELE